MRTIEQIHEYWRNPDGSNHPEDYIAKDRIPRSLFIVAVVNVLLDTDARILEIGCNAGRNLAYLHSNGYTNLEAVEINPEAVKLMRQKFPLLRANVHTSPVENVIGKLPNFDLIFTLATLEHIHPDSEWIFSEMANHTRYILTIEDEAPGIWRQFPRNYGEIFTGFGMDQVAQLGDLRFIGLKDGFVARLFKWR